MRQNHRVVNQGAPIGFDDKGGGQLLHVLQKGLGHHVSKGLAGLGKGSRLAYLSLVFDGEGRIEVFRRCHRIAAVDGDSTNGFDGLLDGLDLGALAARQQGQAQDQGQQDRDAVPPFFDAFSGSFVRSGRQERPAQRRPTEGPSG